jgi:DNA repair exonuclease SbcCD ATPase subunit
MKIKSASIENFKGVKKKIINVDGRSFVVSGPNGAGKSSEIQAMFGVLSGKGLPKTIMPKDSKPGDIARVEVVIGDDKESYHLIATYAEHPETGNVEGKITVKDSENKTVKISAFRNLIGDVSFDIFSGFLQKGKQEQVAFVKELTGKRAELDKLDVERERLYDERTIAKKERTMLETMLKDKSIDSEVGHINTEPILEKIKKIDEKQEKYAAFVKTLDGFKDTVSNGVNEVESNVGRIEALKAEIEKLESRNRELDNTIAESREKVEKGEAWIANNPKPTLGALQQELEEANANNETYAQNQKLKDSFSELVAKKERLEQIEKGMKAIDKQKADIIANSSLPVPGLTFDENGLYLDGVPFVDVNTAKQWEVGARFMVAMNNNLRVCKLDMNVMDKNTFAEIVSLAESHNMQMIFELVNWSAETDETEVRFVEEFLGKDSKA